MERRHEARNEGGDTEIDLVVFSLGVLRFAVDSAHIQGIADPAETPGAPPPALADLLGLARASTAVSAHTQESRERVLRFRHTAQTGVSDGAQSPGVRVEEPISLRRVSIDAIHPLPALMEALSELHCVRGLVALSATNADDLAVLIDTRRLPQEAARPPLGSCSTTPARMIDQQGQES